MLSTKLFFGKVDGKESDPYFVATSEVATKYTVSEEFCDV